jgi:hypothetical protein
MNIIIGVVLKVATDLSKYDLLKIKVFQKLIGVKYKNCKIPKECYLNT